MIRKYSAVVKIFIAFICVLILHGCISAKIASISESLIYELNEASSNGKYMDSYDNITDEIAEKVGSKLHLNLKTEIVRLIPFKRTETPDTYTDVCTIRHKAVFNWFFGAEYNYTYTYVQRERLSNKIVCGSWSIPCKITFKLINGHYEVVNYYEVP